MSPRTPLLSTLLLALLGFSSCESIQTAPKGSPRIEVAVVYRVEESFFSPFTDAIDKKGVQALLQEAVHPLANIGLRFYAIPADQYGKGQKWPDYIMTVSALSCTPDRRVKTTKVKVKDEAPQDNSKEKTAESNPLETGSADGKSADSQPSKDQSAEDKLAKSKPKEITQIRATLYGVSCKLDVQLSKVRVDAPQLIVGESKATGSSSTSRDDKSQKLPLTKKADEENDTALTESMIQSAFSAAAKRAFVELQKPIDRELRSLIPPKKVGAR